MALLSLTGLAIAQEKNINSNGQERVKIDADNEYELAVNKYKRGARNYAEMPKLARTASHHKEVEVANQIANDYVSNYLFKLDENQLFTKIHLQFIFDYIGGTKSKGFKFFAKNREKVNAVLGADKAEYAIRFAIGNEYLPNPSTWKASKPNWNNLEKILREKFGAIGLEVVYGHQMIYYQTIQDWQNFGKYFVLYFERALTRPEYMINNIVWSVFEKVDDQKVLAYAITVMKYNIETWDQQAADAYDTYANLLYKVGKTELAIEWEQRAVKLKKGAPDEKVYIQTLEKIRTGEKTW